MQDTILTTRGWIWLIAAILLAVVGILNLSQRAVHKLPPTDGVMWKLTDNGIFAEKVESNSAAGRARILPGDRLVAVSLDEKSFEEISSPSEIQIYLEEAGIGGRLTYLFQRPSYTFGNNFYYADLNKLESAPRWTPSLLAFAFVGLVYLFIGFFVLFKQGARAPFVLHFAALCLAAFAFHILKPIGTFEDFDAAVAIIDDLAFIFFAPVFLHFCWIYPIRTHFAEKTWQTVLLYVPAILLSVVSIFSYTYGNLPISENALVSLNQWFERTGFFAALYRFMLWHFVAALSVGAGVLIYRYARNKQIIVRQRLKWAMAGSIAAVIPIIAYQIAKGAFNLSAENWLMSLAILPLALIPLTFGHSVVRYRLMDVDIVVRHAVVYALTTLSISTLIGAVAFGFVFFVLGNSVGLNVEGTLTEVVAKIVVAVIAMAAIVMLSAPLKDFLQERADRFFYGERYDMRRSLLDFGKTLSATTQLDLLLNALMSRLQQVLDVEKVAVFIEDEKTLGGYRLARSVNLSEYYRIPADFRSLMRSHSAQGVVRADDFDLAENDNALIRQELHYYVPCVVRGRMIGVLGLGRTRDGSLLSSEDLDILQTISGYIAVAIENSLLYEEQQRRNDELALLKEFNESIVESVNVALLAVDSEGCVTRCNSTAEQIFNLKRDQIVGNKVEELFAEDFADTLSNLLGKTRWHLSEVRHAYKIYTERRDGKSFILNAAVAPLRSPAGEKTGSILVLEDVTSRVSLEEQLQQREKLSSIGMLAAGVAHEVNTPLTGVSSYTQMLLSMIPETDPKHALLQKVAKQTDRASNIVGNLLNFSRAGSSGDFVEINLNKVLEDTLQLLEVQLRKGRIEIVRNFDSGLPPIYGNGGKLQQVFTNLILNARDAIVTEQGRIEITTRYTEDGAIVEVNDNGVGIEPENLSKIYDPFFTTKEVGKGTGLGLAVSYGIIQEHSGDIKVESTPGEGTKFTLKFPLAIPQQQRKAAGE